MASILINATIVCSLILALVAIFYYAKMEKAEQLFANYLIFSAIFEIIAFVTAMPSVYGFLVENNIKNNLPGLHVFTLGQFILLVIYFKQVFLSYQTRIPILLLIVGGLLILINSIFIQSIWQYNSYSKTFVEFMIIFASLFYFYKVLDQGDGQISQKAIHFFVMSIFINAALSSLYYLFSNEMMKMDKALLNNVQNIKNIIQIITQLLVFYGMHLSIKRYKLAEQI